MREITFLKANAEVLMSSKSEILNSWFSYDRVVKILLAHNINIDDFIQNTASSVFDYFISVFKDEQDIGNCPTMQNLLVFLKDKDIRADELFSICTHFRLATIGVVYEKNLYSKEILDEILYVFDTNLEGVLRFYTDSIYQKELEIDKHVRLLEEYKSALDESAIISKIDEDGFIRYINDKYIKLSGYAKDELIGKKYISFMCKDISSAYVEDSWAALKKDGIFKGSFRKQKKNGEYYYVDATIVKIIDPHLNTPEYMSIATDVTTLVDAKAEAQMASQAKEYFLSNMSHEIRTPLNAILGFVNLLIEQELSAQHRKYLEIILNSGENLLSIINDILDFSKLRSGEFTIEPKIFSIHEEISHSLELFVASASVKNITITSFIDPTIPRELIADILRIKQIVSNFLSNAIKFTKSGGHIHVDVSCNLKILTISVSDNGVGVDEDDLRMIFSAFTQATHEDLDRLQGTGLGLSISHQLANLMGGDIFVKSKVGSGSTFWVELPIEVYSEGCEIFSDMQSIKNLKMAIYKKDTSSRYKLDSFLKYANIFNVKPEKVDALDNTYDITILLEDDIDDEIKNKIITSDKKYLILASRSINEYENYAHVDTIHFPIYCSKIKTAFGTLLNQERDECKVKDCVSKKYKGHILIVEDNEANQELIKVILSKYGLTYDLASNGLEAVELFKKYSYDLVLMDEQMPIMDGNEALKHIQKHETERSLKHTPISALTANVVKGVKERSLKSGFDAFLGKPISIKELEALFKRYLKGDTKGKKHSSKKLDTNKIVGLDATKLMDELGLDMDELLMLLELFLNKMQKLLAELEVAVDANEYEKIASIAHSIKGSSANFRIEEINQESSIMEKMAKKKNLEFDYVLSKDIIRRFINNISINHNV